MQRIEMVLTATSTGSLIVSGRAIAFAAFLVLIPASGTSTSTSTSTSGEGDAAIVCIEEFSPQFEFMSEAAEDQELAWDVDLGPIPSGTSSAPDDYRFVWEGRPFDPNVKDGTFSWYSDRRFSAAPGAPTMCCLGQGGNPEVFDEVIVTQMDEGSDEDCSSDPDCNDVRWIRTTEFEPADCASHSALACSNDLQAKRLPMHQVYRDLCAGDPRPALCDEGPGWGCRRRKVVTTDGRFAVWKEWPCPDCKIGQNGDCESVKASDLNGFRFPDPNDPSDLGTLFEVASEAGIQEFSQRIARIDEDRSIVVFQRCAEAECSTENQVYGAILTLLANGEVDVSAPFQLDGGEFGKTNWVDVEGDLVVWDRSPGGLQQRDIYGCQAPLDAAGVPIFERCDENRFRIQADMRQQTRPTVYGDLVAWRDSRYSSEACGKATNIFAAWLERDVDGRIRTEGAGSVPLAQTAQFQVSRWVVDAAGFEVPARQQAPRSSARGHGSRSILLWADTRYVGCPVNNNEQCNDPGPGFCDDVIGAELAMVPAVRTPGCLVTSEGRADLSFDLSNDWKEAVSLRIDERMICERIDQVTGQRTICADRSGTVDVTLVPGSNSTHRSCQCAVQPGEHVEIEFRLEGVTLVGGGASCEIQEPITRPVTTAITCT